MAWSPLTGTHEVAGNRDLAHVGTIKSILMGQKILMKIMLQLHFLAI